MALIHGGQLQKVAEQFNIPTSDWLDLSTGIAPYSYPIPNIPSAAWQQLPQQNNSLITAAKHYYQCNSLLVTNGSQAIIKALPSLWQSRKKEQKKEQQKNNTATHVYLPLYGYKEHAHAWSNAKHNAKSNTEYHLHYYHDELPPVNELQPNCILVIINPNNPTGKLFTYEELTRYQQAIKTLNGLLVIDEAFIDVISSKHSLSPHVNDSHIIVFRSFGKFFGLAGIRIGFLIADTNWCNTFSEYLGPWQVNGPAQYIAEHALSNTLWHSQQKQKLAALKQQQEALLLQAFKHNIISDISGCDLFLTLSFHQPAHAEKLYTLLCNNALYVRLTDEKDKLRLGIAREKDLNKLFSICKKVSKAL